jgi:hypothetical protein
MADGLLPQARWHGAGCGDVLVGAVSSRPTQQVSPPAVAAGLEIEHEEPQSVDSAFVHGGRLP